MPALVGVAPQAGTIKKCNCATNLSAGQAGCLTCSEFSGIRIEGEIAGALHAAPNQNGSQFGDLIWETISGVWSYDLFVLSGFQCSYCGEWNPTEVDESAGASQQYVEDCQVCCRPNILMVHCDRDRQRITIRAQREN